MNIDVIVLGLATFYVVYKTFERNTQPIYMWTISSKSSDEILIRHAKNLAGKQVHIIIKSFDNKRNFDKRLSNYLKRVDILTLTIKCEIVGAGILPFLENAKSIRVEKSIDLGIYYP